MLWRQGSCSYGIRQRQANNAAGGGKDKGQVDDDFYDEEEMFLRLDDVLEVGKDIDMDEGTSPQIQRPLQMPTMLLALDTAGQQCVGVAACALDRLLHQLEGMML
jgi:hypothetical protein